jgi:hypothetical protein
MDATASRKRMADVAASSNKEDKEELSPVTTLEIDVELPNGKRYSGKFQFKVPTLGDRVDIGSTRAKYLDQVEGIDPNAQMIAEMLAYLHITIEDNDANPAWWRNSNRGVDLHHMLPIVKLYTAAIEYQNKYLGTSVGVGEMKKSSEGGSGEANTGVVESNVPAAPERRTIMQIDGKGGPRPSDNVPGGGESTD